MCRACRPVIGHEAERALYPDPQKHVQPRVDGAQRNLEAHLVVARGRAAVGQDQIRFDVALAALAPGSKIVAPIRDDEVSREESTAALKEAGVEIPPKTTRYSINAGIVGTTIAWVTC